jgi:hypothetical protein
MAFPKINGAFPVSVISSCPVIGMAKGKPKPIGTAPADPAAKQQHMAHWLIHFSFLADAITNGLPLPSAPLVFVPSFILLISSTSLDWLMEGPCVQQWNVAQTRGFWAK